MPFLSKPYAYPGQEEIQKTEEEVSRIVNAKIDEYMKNWEETRADLEWAYEKYGKSLSYLYDKANKKKIDTILGEGNESTLREYLKASELYSRQSEYVDMGILEIIYELRGEYERLKYKGEEL